MPQGYSLVCDRFDIRRLGKLGSPDVWLPVSQGHSLVCDRFDIRRLGKLGNTGGCVLVSGGQCHNGTQGFNISVNRLQSLKRFQ